MYDLNRVYDEHFFSTNLDEGRRMARWFVPLLISTFDLVPGASSIIDIGCGQGHYLEDFARRGYRDLTGVEGSSWAVSHAVHTIYQLDLRIPPDTYKHRRDLALCIEVAEHIEAEYADSLVDHVTRGRAVAFTAARPGQGGTCHVNEQPKEYWVERFAARGYRYSDYETEEILVGAKIAKEIGEHVPDWFIPNLMVFKGDRA